MTQNLRGLSFFCTITTGLAYITSASNICFSILDIWPWDRSFLFSTMFGLVSDQKRCEFTLSLCFTQMFLVCTFDWWTTPGRHHRTFVNIWIYDQLPFLFYYLIHITKGNILICLDNLDFELESTDIHLSEL